MPRKSSSKSAAGQEGSRARRARKTSSPTAAPPAETAATENNLQTDVTPAETRVMAAAAGAGAGAGSATQPLITREEIERLAYSYWLARGCQGGSPEEDWFRAEQELRRQRGLSDQQE